MRIFVINLPQSRERRENILGEFARFDLEPEIFPAVDGRELSPDRLRELIYRPEVNPLTPGEIGCALSHRTIYEKMRDENIPFAFILEDDSVLRLDPRPLLAGIAARPPDRPESFLLTHRNNLYVKSRPAGEIAGEKMYRILNCYGANGYVISRAAAKNLLAFQTPVRLAPDVWKLFQLHGLCAVAASEREYVGLGESLAGESGIEGRLENLPRMGRYLRTIRREAPLSRRLAYCLEKILIRPFQTLERTKG
ncbi:MAG: glycosyltransferase family 25 protein [Planctomycetota bacterium]|jgi:glycosyl transferase family 25|nr:glycosyltransferase family 25 protein [Planctomycetota bacterium]